MYPAGYPRDGGARTRFGPARDRFPPWPDCPAWNTDGGISNSHERPRTSIVAGLTAAAVVLPQGDGVCEVCTNVLRYLLGCR